MLLNSYTLNTRKTLFAMVFIFTVIYSLLVFAQGIAFLFKSPLTLFNVTPISIPRSHTGPCLHPSKAPDSRYHPFAVQYSMSTCLEHGRRQYLRFFLLSMCSFASFERIPVDFQARAVFSLIRSINTGLRCEREPKLPVLTSNR